MKNNTDNSYNMVDRIKKKRKAYGHLDYMRKNDENNLTNYFNHLLEEFYDHICFYFKKEIVQEIYPDIHNNLVVFLDDCISRNYNEIVFIKEFHAYAEFALKRALKNHNIDIFSDKCIVSLCKFNNYQTEMIKYNLPGIIANNPYQTGERRDYLCKKLGISKARYDLEVFKMSAVLYKGFRKYPAGYTQDEEEIHMKKK